MANEPMSSSQNSATSWLTISSGGQTGADRAALDAAIACRLPYAGWCPKGGRAEDYPHPPGLLLKYPNLRETPSATPEQRTAWNVRDSSATLVLVNGEDSNSKGTAFTRLCAELIFERPFLQCDLASSGSGASVRGWLMTSLSSSSEPVLNIAGPRESESPGIYSLAYRFLVELFDRLHVRV
jgi:hypothetical protein